MSEHLGHYRSGQIGLLDTWHDKIYYTKGRSEIYPNPKTTSEHFEEGDFLRLWDIYSGALICEFEADSTVNDLVFSHDDKLIAGSMKDTAFLWDVNTGEVVDALPESTTPIGFNANDSYLIVIHEEQNIALWDVQAKQWKQHFELGGLISSAQVSQNDKVVALSKTIDDWQLHQIQL